MKLKLCTALLTAATLVAPLSSVAEKAQDPAGAKRTAVEAYGRLPLSFEPTESPARFLARSGSYAVLVGAGQSAIAVTGAKSGKRQMLRFAFENANPAAGLHAMEPQPGVTNYYLGSDPAKWRLGVKSFAKLRSAGVYPGVDVVYYGDHRRLEFDFVVAPKADPGVIALSFSGMDKLYKEAGGDLVAEVAGQPVRFAKPYAYQKVDGASRPVDADYELSAGGKVHLRLGDYDRTRELIVDPAVTYATFLGGSGTDVGNGIAVDSTGDAYVTGQTCSSNFPLTTVVPPNPSGLTFQGTCDAYVTEFSPVVVGTPDQTIIYTTIIGGSTPANATASGNAIALDSSNNVYITGTTTMTDLPDNVFTNLGRGSILNTYRNGDTDAFIVELNNTGAVVQSSYLGGASDDSSVGYGIAVDLEIPPNVIVVGKNCFSDFPGYNAFETKIEGCVAFITKLDNALDISEEPNNGASAMTPLLVTPTSFFSEFYGGQPVAPIPTAVWKAPIYFPLFAIIEDNEVPPNIQIVTTAGTSATTTGTPTNPWNPSLNGLTTDGTVVWTNLGPVAKVIAATTVAYGVALDTHGDIFVAGGTDTANLGFSTNTWFGPYSTIIGTGAWVIKVSGGNGKLPGTVNQTAGNFVYGTALETTPMKNGKVTTDTARAIAVDTSGDAYVAGTATGTIFTTTGAYQPAINGPTNAFLVEMGPDGGLDIQYGTYLGGSGNDQGLGVAVNPSGAAYVTGSTTSSNFPTINPLTEPDGTPITTLLGSPNAYITKFNPYGSTLLFSAYLGGSGSDWGNAIALDTGISGTIDISTLGNMYVAGTTSSVDFETDLDPNGYTPPQTTYGGGDSNAFVAEVAGNSIATVTVTPGSLNFGAEDVGSSTLAKVVTYTNTNAYSSVYLQSITFGGIDPGDFMQVYPGTAPGDCYGEEIIAAGAYCYISVVFTPAAAGGRSGTLIISDDASTKPHMVTLTGTGEVPHVSLTPSLTFASAAVPQTIGVPTAAQSVTLKDTGQGPLNIGSIGITGADPGDFSQTNTCPAQLAAGSTCSISVIFDPTVPGTRTAYLTVTDNAPDGGGTQSIPLTGYGAPPLPTIATTPPSNPLTLNFSTTQPVGVTSAPMTVTVTNNNTTTALTISTPVITAPYQVASNTCGTSLAASASCVIGVTFTPPAALTYNGTLTFSTNASSTPVTVILNGTGFIPPPSATIKLSPVSVLFGNQAENTKSSPKTVTLTNSGTLALAITGIALTANTGTDFAISSNNCPASLGVSLACQIGLTFTPSKTGVVETATLTVTAPTASNSPQTVTISGTGVVPPPPDFTLTPVNSGGESVTHGGIATFIVSVTPQNSYKGKVTFTCTGTGPACPVSPTSVTLDGKDVASVRATINTRSAANKSATYTYTFTGTTPGTAANGYKPETQIKTLTLVVNAQ